MHYNDITSIPSSVLEAELIKREVTNNKRVTIEGHNVTSIEFKVSETNSIVIEIGSDKYKITEDDLLRLKVLFDIVKKEVPRTLVNTSDLRR